jgi:hypothetical protein
MVHGFLLLLALPSLLIAGECARLPRHLFHPLKVPDRFDGRSPIRYWRKANFSGSCQGLNLCYSRLGSERALCDQEFLRELTTACQGTYDGAYEEEAQSRCLLAVQRWKRALKVGGPRAFRDAQYEARWLEGRGKRKVPRPKRKWLTEENLYPPSSEVRNSQKERNLPR